MKLSTLNILNQLIKAYPQLSECMVAISDAAQALIYCYQQQGKLLVCGNGGSAADSEHIVGELMKAFRLKRPIGDKMRKKLEERLPRDTEKFSEMLENALPAISLVGQSALTTAIQNDVSGDMVFAQQIFGYGEKTDTLMLLSTSGNSVNIVNAAKAAKLKDVTTIALTGSTGGQLKTLCDITITVPAIETYQVQELHLPIYHSLCAMVENEFFGTEK